MRKIHKITNIVLIFMLTIEIFLCNEVYCLRAPLQSSSFMQESSPEHKDTVSRRWFIELVKKIVKVNASEERQQEAIKKGALVMGQLSNVVDGLSKQSTLSSFI